MTLNFKSKYFYAVSTVILLLLAIFFSFQYFKPQTTIEKPNQNLVKIGVISDFSAQAANLGVATKLGFDMAKSDLQAENINLELTFEDYKFDSSLALGLAKKLETITQVDGFYIDFNPGILSAQSYLKDIPKPTIYNAAAMSPLKQSDNFFKSFIDFKDTCRQIAQKFKDRNVSKIGQIKQNIEFGELCNQGIKEIYGDDLLTLSFDQGETDFKPLILKAKGEQVQAIMVVSSFESDLITTLKAMKELDLKVPVGGSESAYTQKIKAQYSDFMGDSIRYDLEVNQSFSDKIKQQNTNADSSTYAQTATAYLHGLQLGRNISKCDKQLACIKENIAKSPKNYDGIPFDGFVNRIAKFKLKFN